MQKIQKSLISEYGSEAGEVNFLSEDVKAIDALAAPKFLKASDPLLTGNHHCLPNSQPFVNVLTNNGLANGSENGPAEPINTT